MKILIAGMGYVGEALFERLAPGKREVWGLRRSTPTDLARRQVRADLSTGEGIEQLPPDIGQIAIAISPDRRTDEAYQRAYPHVIENLTKHFPRARLLLVSSTTVYAQGDGELISDESPAESDSFSAIRIREAETLLLAHGNKSCVLRASGIYGPGRTRMISRLAHEELSTEEAGIWTNRIHRDDLAGALGFLIRRKDLGGVFVASDPTPATLGDVQEWIVAHPASPRLPRLSATGGSRRRKNRRLTPSRLLSEDFSFRYPSYKDGYAEILEALPPSGA